MSKLGCMYCSEILDSNKIQEHQSEHVKSGDISIKELQQHIENEKKLVIEEISICKECAKRASALSFCNHHETLIRLFLNRNGMNSWNDIK